MMDRLVKFFRLLSAAASIAFGKAQPKAESLPEASSQPQALIDFRSDSTLFRLMQDEQFRRVLAAISTEEVAALVAHLRDQVRNDRHSESARAEAALTVFEDLPVVFAKYASLYVGSTRQK